MDTPCNGCICGTTTPPPPPRPTEPSNQKILYHAAKAKRAAKRAAQLSAKRAANGDLEESLPEFII